MGIQKNKMIIKIIVSILLAYLMVYIIYSLFSNTYLAQPELDHVVLDFIFACCIVIIALIVIFGFLILNKHK